MLSRRNGGFVEFIPSPQEKREAVLRDHALDLLQNLHLRCCEWPGRTERGERRRFWGNAIRKHGLIGYPIASLRSQ
ncbi:MAG TPA: hypothetical protein PKZ01_06275 [Candidatus Hydrogenedentes bacterium]|nr:hypothetical protein [Candidatus Hydrogenedentota bacterium]